jgi:GNAT superfamily N-acetyltransferase
MKIKLIRATMKDAPALYDLRVAVARKLQSQFDDGFGAAVGTIKGVLFDLRHNTVFVAKRRGRIIATLMLATKKPWSIDRKFLTKVKRPLYLLAMAVSPNLQRKGLGRACIDEAIRIARKWPADSICLDAFDAPSGAGDFYRKCGFTEIGRAAYRNSPLIYFELLL